MNASARKPAGLSKDSLTTCETGSKPEQFRSEQEGTEETEDCKGFDPALHRASAAPPFSESANSGKKPIFLI